MSKSTNRAKIRYANIRQTKTDYFMHFITSKANVIAVGLVSFILGSIFVVNLSVALANQPTLDPPGGNVNGRFNSLNVTTGPTNLTGLLNVSGATSLTGQLYVSGQTRLGGGLILDGGLQNAGAGPVLLGDPEGVDIWGTIRNSGPINGGNVIIDDHLRLTAGKRVGSFYKAYNTTGGSVSPPQVTTACRPGTYLVSCSGVVTGNSNDNVITSIRGAVPNAINNTCTLHMFNTRLNISGGNIVKTENVPFSNGQTLQAQAICFDPTGTRTADEVY